MHDTAEHAIFWIGLGYTAQVVFGARFIVQWIASERAGRSTIPIVFWYLSILGSLLYLIYACYEGTRVGWVEAGPFILGYSFNTVPYVRNLMLIRKEQSLAAAQGATDRPRPVGAGSPQDLETARG